MKFSKTKIKSIFNSISKDLLYSIAGLCLMNGVVQLFVNPYLQRKMGSEKFGIMLSLISVLTIVAISFGTSANYSRMLSKTKNTQSNSDYLIMLLFSVLFIVPVCIVSLLYFYKLSIPLLIGYIVLTVFTAFRYYGDVDFRLKVDFKGFFLYYAFISVGYVSGALLFGMTKSWIIVFLLGEAAALIFVFFKGDVLRCFPLKKSEHFKINFKSTSALFVSSLITSVLSNVDRPIILKAIDANSVTVFYAATLIGKIIALLTVPLNSVVISYLTKYDGKLKRKTFSFLFATSLLLTAVMSVFCIFISYFFVKIMYPNVYESAKPLIPVAIVGQIFYFISGTLMTVLLRFTKERLQYIINGIYFAVYMTLCLIGINQNGLSGFAAGILIANVFRMALTYILGMVSLKTQDN